MNVNNAEENKEKFTVRRIGVGEKNIINEIAHIHVETFQGFFLTFLGKGFLKKMYEAYCEHAESDLLVAFQKTAPVGFLAYSEDLSGLYRYMIKKKLVYFAWYSMGAFFRNPKIFLRLIRAFLKPKESERNVRYVELASIGVHPKYASSGIGTLLIQKLKSEVDFNFYEYITLETDEIDNDTAILFYERNGFIKERSFVTHEGRRMIEYRYKK